MCPPRGHGSFGADDEAAALAFLEEFAPPYVVKTDGLAAGKGVVVTESLADARDAVRAYLSGEAFGDAGRTLVIEEGLAGPELSLLVVCNGDPDAALPLAPAQDFKRARRRRRRPQHRRHGRVLTGADRRPTRSSTHVMDRAVRPTLRWLADHDADYRGVLYAGMMLTADGPKVIEYNVRFGDPETPGRAAARRVRRRRAPARGRRRRARSTCTFTDDACVTVVLAADGYPASPRTGDPITGLDVATAVNGVTVFHAGTARDEHGVLRTAGGRVLDVTATGADLEVARTRAYEAAGLINCKGMRYRRTSPPRQRAHAAAVRRQTSA